MSAALVATLSPIGTFLAGLDPSDVDGLARALDREFPPERMRPVTEALLAAHAEGWLTPREAGPGIRFGRLSRPSPELGGHSVDVVDIAGAGAPHRHPRGEVSWCVPLEGEPVFEGAREGWVVLGPGSHHTPTVTGGRMLIAYFLPEGAVAWDAA